MCTVNVPVALLLSGCQQMPAGPVVTSSSYRSLSAALFGVSALLRQAPTRNYTPVASPAAKRNAATVSSSDG